MTRPKHPPSADLLADVEFVKRLARNLCGDEHLAEDVAQQAMVSAMETPPDQGSSRRWLAVVARNVLYKERRAQARRASRERASARDLAAPSAEAVLEQDEARRAVARAVLAMHEQHRQILLLRFYQGTSVRDCAAQYGITASAVRSRIARALDRLRARLDDSYDGDRRRWMVTLLPFASSQHPKDCWQRAEQTTSQVRRSAKTTLVASLTAAAAWVAFASLPDPAPPAASRASETSSNPRSAPVASPALDRHSAHPKTDGVALAAQDPRGRRLAGSAPMTSDILTNDRGESWLSCRIVDDFTGRPIPGAEVLMLAENEPQIAGERPACMAFEADKDGLVLARVDANAPGFVPFTWVCVRAPGYGHQMEFRSLGSAIIRLPPQVEIPVEVRDWRDQPVEHVLVSCCGGNGFTPDLETGRTDSRGRLTLTGVDLHSTIADFYLVHPELHYGYFSPDWYPGQGPLVLRPDPGLAHRGIVVTRDGRPVVGAAVGTSKCQRGPWTRTGSDGSFELCGLRAATALRVRVAGRRIQFAEAGVDGLRLQLPPRADDDAEGVQVVDLSPKQRAQRAAARRQAARELAEGNAPAATAVIRVVGLPSGGAVKIRTRAAATDISEQVRSGLPVAVPDEECVFWLEADGDRRIVPLDRDTALDTGFVELRWYAPTRVRGRALDQDGAAARAQVAFADAPDEAPDEDTWRSVQGRFSVPAAMAGARWMHVRGPGARLRVLPVNLPARGDDAAFDVGDVVLAAGPLYRFELPDGTPLVEGSVVVKRVGWTNTGPTSSQNWTYEADDDGHFWLPELRPGDALVVHSERPEAPDASGLAVYDLPSHFLIDDPVPQVFRMHPGELVIDVASSGSASNDPENAPVVTFDDQQAHLTSPGRSVIRGLKVKTYDIIAGRPWRPGVVVPFEVTAPGADGSRRIVRIQLP